MVRAHNSDAYECGIIGIRNQASTETGDAGVFLSDFYSPNGSDGTEDRCFVAQKSSN